MWDIGGENFELNIDPEIANVLVTVSGLIFAFQPTFFKRPSEKTFRILFLVIFFS